MDTVIAYMPSILKGTWITIAVASCSIVLAVLLGLLGAWGKLAVSKVANIFADAYTTLIRGVPDLVLMLLLFYGGQQLLNDLGDATGWWDYLEINHFTAGVFTIGFIYGAYMTETFRGAYLTVPRGQGEAAKALGMTPLATLWTVQLPQILRFALPGYGNVWLVLVKSTAVVSVIGLGDLVGLADKAGKASRSPFLFFVAVILVYLAITWISSLALKYADERVNRGFAA